MATRFDADKHMFEKLLNMQCTQLEICNFFECDKKTLVRWVKRTYKKSWAEIAEIGAAGGKASLRRIQWQQAEKSPQMAMFLGINYLGQSKTPKPTQTNHEDISTLADLLNVHKAEKLTAHDVKVDFVEETDILDVIQEEDDNG